jgi:hypothetical protein
MHEKLESAVGNNMLIDLKARLIVNGRSISGASGQILGSGIRELARLRKRYGRGRWRKRKGYAEVRLSDGAVARAELHWYEATGIGKREFKIKRFL